MNKCVNFININLLEMKGISFVMDENNRKVAVQISYDVYGEFLEDFLDVLIAESRKDDEKISLEEFSKELRSEGLL